MKSVIGQNFGYFEARYINLQSTRWIHHKFNALNRAWVAEKLRTLCCGIQGCGFKHHQCLWIGLQVCGLKRLHCHADHYTVSRCHHRGESEEYVTHRRENMQTRDLSWLWNPGQMSPEVQNRGISGSTKRTCVLQFFFLKVQCLWYKQNVKKLCWNAVRNTHYQLNSSWHGNFLKCVLIGSIKRGLKMEHCN